MIAVDPLPQAELVELEAEAEELTLVRRLSSTRFASCRASTPT